MTTHPETRDQRPEKPTRRRRSRVLILAVALAGLIAVAVALAFGSPVTQIAVALIALTALQGTILGAAETAGLVAALALAALVAFPLGRAIEDSLGGLIGASGVAKRAAAIAAAAAVALILGSLVFGVISRRLVRTARRGFTDRSIGGALGLVEGVFLALLALWGLFALEPVAETRLASSRDAITAPDAPEPPKPNDLASRVLAITESASNSFIGRLARDANPFAETTVVAMADDYLVVVRDSAALEHFLESDAVRRLNETPSFQRALEIIRTDPDVRAALDRGLDRRGLRALFESDAILRALDDTGVVRDLEPLADELREALEQAKARARPRPAPR